MPKNEGVILYAAILLLVELKKTSESLSAIFLFAQMFSVDQCETGAVQEFIVAFFICTTVFLFLLIAIRRIQGLILLVAKHDAFILFSFSERRGSDNKLPIQRDLSHTAMVIVLGHAVQTYVSGPCCFDIMISRSRPFRKNDNWKSL